MDWLRNVHFYRKVPRDLTEATLTGGTLSLISSLVMAYLFCSNFLAYLSVDTTTSIVLDSSDEKKLQLNFNVTLHHLPCAFASLDIVDEPQPLVRDTRARGRRRQRLLRARRGGRGRR